MRPILRMPLTKGRIVINRRYRRAFGRGTAYNKPDRNGNVPGCPILASPAERWLIVRVWRIGYELPAAARVANVRSPSPSREAMQPERRIVVRGNCRPGLNQLDPAQRRQRIVGNRDNPRNA